MKILPLRSEEGKLELEIAEEDEETLIASAIFTPNQSYRKYDLKVFLVVVLFLFCVFCEDM